MRVLIFRPFSAVSRHWNHQLLAAITVDAVMGAHPDFFYTGRYLGPGNRSGKGGTRVRMKQNARIENLPAVGIVIPAFIVVLHRCPDSKMVFSGSQGQ
jgi:hypothetical protein